MSRHRYKLTWLAASERPCVREYLFEGTFEDLNRWFRDEIICNHCREEMKGGPQEHYFYVKGQLVGVETMNDPPYDDPFATGCGLEYEVLDLGEIE